MGIKEMYRKLSGSDRHFGYTDQYVQFTGQDASTLIEKRLLTNTPFMLSRIGATEMRVLANFLFLQRAKLGWLSTGWNYLNGIPYGHYWRKSAIVDLNEQSGFFPKTESAVASFSKLYIEDIADIDILGSWMKQEKFLFPFLKKDHQRIHLEDISPFVHQRPWSVALAGKRVAVVHPFAETIEQQYRKRKVLFANPDTLPEFDLVTIKAVQTSVRENAHFNSWFDALDHMTEQIARSHASVVIIGCGAYGLPLAARAKKMGKSAIHIGGATQILFGVKGARWESAPYHFQDTFYNEHWVRPNASERPPQANILENACYW